MSRQTEVTQELSRTGASCLRSPVTAKTRSFRFSRFSHASGSFSRGIAIYTIPNTPSVTNPAGAAAPEAASKRVIWISAGGKKLYTKKMAVADPKTDTTVISAATDEVQEHLIGEYVTAFTGTVNASTEKASVAVSFDMQYLEQKYTIQNEFKLRNVLR